jgi:hypothetical protein
MMLAPSTLVPIIDRLESDGLLVRGKDPDDRRRTPLVLTQQARDMLASVPEMGPRDQLCHALQALGPERSRQLSLLLQALVNEMPHGHDIVRHVLAMSPRITQRAAGYTPDESHTSTSTEAE